MKLMLLGTAGYHPSEERHTACLMLPELGIVVDAGTAMFRVRDLIRTPTLDIFLSHAHLDHVVGLTYLLDVVCGKDMERVTVHGEQAKLEAIERCLFAPLLFPVEPPYEPRPLVDNPLPVPGDGRLTHFPLEHPGGSLGFRFDWPGRSLAYVTDTTASADADYVESIRGVDVLVHECNFRDQEREHALTTGHSHTTPVVEVARKAEVGRLVLAHINPLTPENDPIDLQAAREIFPATEIARDNLSIDF